MAGLGEIPPGMDITGMPAGEAPPGIEANFVDPENRGPAYIAVAVICMALATTFVVTRLYTRFFVLKNPWWDDLVVVIALLCQGAYCGLNIWLCINGVGKEIYNVYLTDFLRLLDPAQAMAIMTEPAIGFTKLALLLFFCHLFWRDTKTRNGALVGIAVVVTTYTILFFLFIFLQYEDIARCNKAMAILNIATDFYILLLPVPVVVGLQLPASKKYALIGLFSTGFLCCVLSIVGAYYRWTFSDYLLNFTWDLWPVIIVNTIECAVGIMCACLPVFPALLKSGRFSGRWLTPLKSVRDRIRGTTRGGSTGRSKMDTAKSYTRVDDIGHRSDGNSLELGQSDSGLSDEKSLVKKPQPTALRGNMSSPGGAFVRTDVQGSQPLQANPPPTGIEVRRDWIVESEGRHSMYSPTP